MLYGITSSEFTYLGQCVSDSFLLSDVSVCSLLLIGIPSNRYITLLMQSPADEHLCCFQGLATINNDAVNIYVPVFGGYKFLLLL